MTRNDAEKHISDTYNTMPDYPWFTYPKYAVYRHQQNKKWFAVIMDIEKNKLGINSADNISIINLKCESILIGSLLQEKGFFPAYHMNKEHWITVILDGSVNREQIKHLIDISFSLTE